MKRTLAFLFWLWAAAAQAQVYTPPVDVSSITAQMTAIAAKIPNATGVLSGLGYSSICSVVVNSSTPTSTFCPPATDPNSVVKRTYPANAMTPGKAFALNGGGSAVVPTGNLLTADVYIKVGSAIVVTVNVPNAPIGNNIGVDFHATCTVRTTTTINCQGLFSFKLAGSTPVDITFSPTATFDPTVANVIDVTGDWNGTTSTHATTVTEAVFMMLN